MVLFSLWCENHLLHCSPKGRSTLGHLLFPSDTVNPQFHQNHVFRSVDQVLNHRICWKGVSNSHSTCWSHSILCSSIKPFYLHSPVKLRACSHSIIIPVSAGKYACNRACYGIYQLYVPFTYCSNPSFTFFVGKPVYRHVWSLSRPMVFRIYNMDCTPPVMVQPYILMFPWYSTHLKWLHTYMLIIP